MAKVKHNKKDKWKDVVVKIGERVIEIKDVKFPIRNGLYKLFR